MAARDLLDLGLGTDPLITQAPGSSGAQLIEFPLVDRERALRALAEAKLAALGETLLDLADLSGSVLGISLDPLEIAPDVVVVAHLRRWS